MTDADVTPIPEPTPPTDGVKPDAPKPPKEPVPYDRFAEVNRLKNDAEKKLKEYETAEAERQAQARKDDEKKQIEAGEFEKVLNELRPKAEKFEQLEAFVKARFEKVLEGVPEELRDIIPPGLDIETTWTWLESAQAKGQFKKPDVPNLNGGVRGEHGKPLPNASEVLKKRNY